MKSKILVFLIGLLPLTALKCDGVLNPDPKLPPVTTEGKNTMGCKINGEVWDIMGINGGKNNYYQSGLLFISGSRDINGNNNTTAFSFSKSANIGEGKSYDLTDYNNTFVDFIYKSCRYERYQTLHGSITLLRFDTKARIVSGTFEFITYNPDCGDTVRVTEGRFDFGHLAL